MPVRQQYRNVNPKIDALIKKDLDKMLDVDIIFAMQYSKWATNLVLVWNKNGDIQLCVDFRDLNQVSVKDNFHLSFIDVIL